MRKKKYRKIIIDPLYPKKQIQPQQKLYGYVINVDDLITMHDDTPVTEDIDYIEITEARKLLE